MRHNGVVIDTTPGLIHLPVLTVQIKSTASATGAKPQVVLTHDNITVPSITARMIIALVYHPSEWNTTDTVTPTGKFIEAASLLISHSMST